MTGIEKLRDWVGTLRLSGLVWADHMADELESIAEQIKRETQPKSDPAADVSMSAYDLLPPDEREAIEWVREHGGIAYVKDAWNVRSNLDRQLEREQAKVERQQRHIEFVQRKCRERQERVAELSSMFREADYRRVELCSALGIDPGTGWADAMVAMHRRLMPEGMGWPRFEDGEPVRPGDKLQDKDGDWFEAVSFVFTCDWWSTRGYQSEGFGDLNDNTRRSLEGMAYGTRVKRPAPKVLDADGAEIRVGDEVFVIETGKAHHVTAIDPIGKRFKSMEQMGDDATWLDPMCFTHRAPVLAADGKPLRVGETVWHKSGFAHGVVESVDAGSLMHTTRYRDKSGGEFRDAAKDLTHERPAPKDDWKSLFDWIRRPGIHTDADFAEFERRAKALAGDA